MNTAQLIIVCVTALAALVIVTQAHAKRKAPLPAAERRLLAAEIGVAIAHKLNSTLSAQLAALDQIAEHTTPVDPVPIENAERVGPAVGARVAVHKLDGQTLQGEIVAQDADEIVLEKVDVITAGSSQATGGRFHISRDRIDSIQEL